MADNKGGAVQLITKEDMARLAVTYGKQNIIPIPLFDKVEVANGNTLRKLQFMSHTLGKDGIYVTNMESANQLISNKQFVLKGLRLNAIQQPNVVTSLADIQLLLESKASYTLKISGAEFAQGPLSDLIGGGLFGFGHPLRDATNFYAYGAYVTPRAVARTGLDTWLLIPTQTNFTFEVEYETAPNPTGTVRLELSMLGSTIRQATA